MKRLVAVLAIGACHHEPAQLTPYDASLDAYQPDAPPDAPPDAHVPMDPPACIYDDECEVTHTCNEHTAACIAPAGVIFVQAAGSDTTDCTFDEPCKTLAHAITKLTATRKIISLKGVFDESGSFDLGGHTVLFSGPTTDPIAKIKTTAGIVLTNGAAELQGIAFEQVGTASVALLDTQALTETELWHTEFSKFVDAGVSIKSGVVEDSTFHDGTGIAIEATGTVTVTRIHAKSIGTFVSNVSKVDNCVLDTVGALANTAVTGDFLTLYQVTNLVVGNTATLSNTLLAPIPTGPMNCTYCLFPTGTSPLPAGAGNIAGDPKLISSADPTKVLHLDVGSAAIDAADHGSTVALDCDGLARPVGPERDIGAFEKQGQ